MFDLGWSEILVIAIVMVVVVGPKDLPRMLRTFGKTTRKMRSMATDFRRQFDDALADADLDDVRSTISDVRKLNPANSIKDALNPLREAGESVKRDIDQAGKTIAASATGAAAAGVSATKPVEASPVVLPDQPVKLPDGQPDFDKIADLERRAREASEKADAAKPKAAAKPAVKQSAAKPKAPAAKAKAAAAKPKKAASPKTKAAKPESGDA